MAGTITTIGEAVAQTVSKVKDKETIVPTYFTSKTADLFNLFSPQLTPFTDATTLTFDTLKKKRIPVGSPIALSALSPPIKTDLLTTGSAIPFTSPANFTWRVYRQDFDENASGTFDLSKADVQPSASSEAIGGAYQLLKGDLLSNDLSFVPWPSTTSAVPSNTKAPTNLRAFVVRLEISLWVPGYSRTSFIHPIGLAGCLDSWASVLGADDLVVSATPPVLKEGEVDKLAIFRNLFDIAIDTVAPELGKAATLLISPVDKTPTVPGLVSQILEQTPQLTVQAGIDVGAMLKGLTQGVGDLLGLPARDSNVNEAVINIGKILNSIFAIPIAVNVNGVSRTKTIIPSSPVAIPSIKSLPGSSLLTGSLPLGSLTNLIKSDLTGATLSFTQSGGGDPSVLSTPIPGLAGFRILPLPRISSIDSDKPSTISVAIKIPVKLQIPGRSTPISVDINLPVKDIQVPALRVPSIALLFRSFQSSYPEFSPDILALPDPYTSRAYRNQSTRAILDSFLGDIRKLMKLFPRELFPKIPPALDDLSNLLDGASRMVDAIANPKAKVLEFPIPDADVGQSSLLYSLENIRGPDNKTKWFDSTLSAADNANVSSLMWLGVPELDQPNSYRLRVILTGEGIPLPGLRSYGSLWIPLPGSVLPFYSWSADQDPPQGVGYAVGQKNSSGRYVENGPEAPVVQAKSKDDPSWNDEPKLINWFKGKDRP